jgi:O-antigen/teichoic acid export membrane protein
MKKGRTGISIIANIVSVVVSVGVSFFLTPFLISSIGKEAYSFYPLANNFVSYMTIITLALNSMASRFITIELTKGNTDKANRYFSSVFYSNIILSAVLIIPMIVIVSLIDHFLNVPDGLLPDVRFMFALMFCSMLINLISSVFGVATFAKERMDLRAGQDISVNIIRALLYILLFSLFRPTIVFLGIVSCMAALLNGGFQFVFSRVLMPECKLRITSFDRGSVFLLIKSGIWNSINSVGSVLTMSISVLLANTLLGASAAGDLSIIQTLPHLISSVISAVYGVFLSKIAVMYAHGNAKATVEYVKYTQKVLGIICNIPVVIIMILGKYFFKLWVPGENAAYLHILSIITLFPVMIHSCMWTVYGLNVTNNKLKVPAFGLVITGIISIMSTFILIKTTNLGIYSIAISSSITNGLFYMLFIPIYAARKMDISGFSFFPTIIKTILFGFGYLLLTYPLQSVFESLITNWFMLIFVGGILEIIGVIVYFIVIFNNSERKEVLHAITGIFNKNR